MQELRQFVSQVIDEKKLNGLTDDVKDVMIDDIVERLNGQVNQAIIGALNDEQTAALSQKMDSPDFTEENMQEFIVQSGVDARQIMIDSLVAFRQGYLGDTAEA